MMQAKCFWFSVTSICVLCICLTIFLFILGKDRGYSTSSSFLSSDFSQNITKEFWSWNDHDYKKMMLFAKHSRCSFQEEKKKFALIESLEDMEANYCHCSFDGDELSYLYSFHADIATGRFPANQWSAKHLSWKIFHAGKEISYGKAKAFSWDMEDGKTPALHALSVRASMEEN